MIQAWRCYATSLIDKQEDKDKRRKIMTAAANAKTGDREIVITRKFDEPRDLVWRAWTEPEHFAKWWGPKDFTSPNPEMDFREGGKYLWCMLGSDGKEFYSTGVFREIVPFEKIVLTDSFSDAEGNVISASEHGLPGDWPKELLITVTFDAGEGGTEMTVRQVGVPAGEMSKMTTVGWNQSFDKLAESLK